MPVPVRGPETISRSALRRFISELLRTSADLDAFTIDFFPRTFKRFSAGMDFTAKVNLLFELSDTDEIIEALTQSFPDEVKSRLSSIRPVPEVDPVPVGTGPVSTAPHVVCLLTSNNRDRDAYSELKTHLVPRLRAGSMTLWSPADAYAGENMEAAFNEHLDRAAVVVLFVSPDLLADDGMDRLIRYVLMLRAQGRCVVLPVLIRPVAWEQSLIGGLQPLPRDQVPISSRKDRDAVWVEVAQGLSQALVFSGTREAVRGDSTTPEPTATTPDGTDAEPLGIGVIFTTTRTPEYTYVLPAEYIELRGYLKDGARTVVQGPSGSGKSSIVQKALDDIKRSDQWLRCSEDADVILLQGILNAQVPLSQSLVIDEAHLLEPALLTLLSKYIYNLPQVPPHQSGKLPKPPTLKHGITVIGLGEIRQVLLNHIGPGLRHPLEKRLMLIALSSSRTPEAQRGLEKMIALGESVANIQFTQARELIDAAGGSFYILQELCFLAATIEGVETAQRIRKRVNAGLAEVLTRMMKTLKKDYAGRLSSLAKTDQVTPPRGAVAVLLWMLGRSADGEIGVEVARAQYPVLSPVFDWLLAGNLASALQTHHLTWLLEFELGTNLLKAQDPRFLFYLRFLDWAAFLGNTGHTDLRLRADGLLHLDPVASTTQPTTPEPPIPEPTPVGPSVQPNATTVSQTASSLVIPPALAEALAAGLVIPFAGAGVSRAVKRKSTGKPLFPDWKELLLGAAELLNRSGKGNYGKAVTGLAEIGDSDTFLQAAKQALAGLGPAAFYKYLRETLDPKSSEVDPNSLALAQSLWALGSKLVITTNYDHVLHWACPRELRDDQRTWDISAPAEFANMLSSGLERETVWHLHGYVGNLANIILTPDGYRRLYPENLNIQGAYEASRLTLRTLLASRPLLFVGFSFTDEIFSEQVRWIADIFQGASITHYVMTEKSKLELTRERLRGLSSIDLIPYESRETLPALLRSLAPATP